jgi:hypothetical protein
MQYVSRERQIAHLKEPANLAKFMKFNVDSDRDVDTYFADYAEEYTRDNGGQPDALYMCVCADLGIVPLQPDREVIDRAIA